MSFDIQNKKIELIQWLTTVNDNNIIQKILDLRNNESKDWWNKISDKEKISISKGLSDVEKGNTKPHSEVKKFMKSGYKIFWTENALNELSSTYEYLDKNFTTKELKKLSIEIEHILELISKIPIYSPFLSQKKLEK